MRKSQRERILSLFKNSEELTQKEVAARLGVTVSAANKFLRTLYESGALQIRTSPGMSMRYSRNSDLILRTPAGSKISLLYSKESPVRYRELIEKLMVSAVTEILNAPTRERLAELQGGVEDFIISELKRVSPLWDILVNASFEEVQATKADLDKKGKPA